MSQPHRQPFDRLAPLLTRENPAMLAPRGGKLIGIISPHDLPEQPIRAR